MADVTDLGHGVRVQPGTAGRLAVISTRVAMGWRVPEGRVTGTAVAVGETVYQVTRRDLMPDGERWELSPWPEGEAARAFVVLDREWVERRAAEAADARRDGRRRMLAAPWLMLLGLAPTELQRRWRREWGFPAWRATRLSIWTELLLGAAGMIQIVIFVAAGSILLPWWLALPGPLLFAEGLGRYWISSSDGEPRGSVLGLPIALVARRRAAQEKVAVPTVRHRESGSGVLALVSPEVRRDWEGGGRLPFRGDWYRLRATRQEGRDWVYVFSLEEPTDPATENTLRLRPVPSRTAPTTTRTSLNVLETTVVTAAVCLAPAHQQRRWAARFDTRPVWFTIIGAGAEIVGSMVNLGRVTASAAALMVALDAVFLLDGVGRLVVAAVRRGPVGSVVGWLIAPLIEPRLPPDDTVVR